MVIKIGIVDDHELFSKSLGLLLATFKGLEVVVSAFNGTDLQQKLNSATIHPDIILIDVEMPVMNGLETAKWLREKFPCIKLVALSMNENEATILRMIQAGCSTYLLKDTNPEELEHALKQVHKHNYYNADLGYCNLGQLLLNKQTPQFSEKEMEFLRAATSDHTYKQIAAQMKVSERTVDGYRESCFGKFHVQSRTGMVLEALRRGMVKI